MPGCSARYASTASVVLANAPGCGGADRPLRPKLRRSDLALTSTAFENGGAIPRRHACDGAGVSPPLEFRGVPDSAAALVLWLEDRDAPDPDDPGRPWMHWIVFDLPPDARGLAEGAASLGLPEGARQGRNDLGTRTYSGPCPVVAEHRYFFELFALDAALPPDLGETPRKRDLVEAMSGHVLARATLIGTYEIGTAETGTAEIGKASATATPDPSR